MKALIWLILLIGTATAVSDCELCAGPISAIYGTCSPELILNYMNQTGMTEPVEWICLTESPIEGEPTEEGHPITAFGMENHTIKIFSPTKGNIFIFPSMDGFKEWGANYDPKTGTIGWYILYNFTASKIGITPTAKFKIYAPFTLSKNETQIGTSDLFVNFTAGTLISKAEPTLYGYDIEIPLTSRTGIQNISGTVGLASTCSWTCLDVRDFIMSFGECSGCTNVLIGSTFTYFRGKVDDIYNTCSIDPRSICTQFFKYNGDGSVVTIPTSDASKKIDCNGAACLYKVTTIGPIWTYMYPKCRNVDSGHIVRTEFDTTGLMSPNRAYSCVSANTAPGVYLTGPANNSNLTNPPPVNFTFYYVDAQNSTANCSLWINGTIWANNASTSNNTNTSFQVSFNYSATNMSWWVNCSDGLLSNVSATWYFSVHPSGPGWGLGLSLIPLILIILATRMSSLPLQFGLIATAILVIIAGLSSDYTSGYLDPTTAMILQYTFILLLMALSAWFIGPIVYQGVKSYGQR